MNTLIIAALISSAFAGTTRAEALESEAELARDHRAIQDDSADLRSLDRIISSWQSASRHGARGAELTADRALQDWLRQEIAESQQELSQARGEVRSSKRELERELAEANRSYGRHASQERAEARDDARDLKDDHRDLAAMELDLRELQDIASRLQAMQPRFEQGRASGADYAAKSGLLARLRSLSQREVQQSHAELSEDLIERSEARWD
jgi:hypothetical protein